MWKRGLYELINLTKNDLLQREISENSYLNTIRGSYNHTLLRNELNLNNLLRNGQILNNSMGKIRAEINKMLDSYIEKLIRNMETLTNSFEYLLNGYFLLSKEDQK